MKVRIEKRERMIIVVVISIVVILVGYRYVYQPKIFQMRKLRGDLQTLLVKIRDARETSQDLSTLEKETELIQDQLSSIKRRMIAKEEVSRILKELSEAGGDYNLNFVSLKPEVEKGSEILTLGPELCYRKMPIKVEVRCRYRDLGEYLGKLRDLPILATVDGLNIQGEERVLPDVKAQLLLNVYVLEEISTDVYRLKERD